MKIFYQNAIYDGKFRQRRDLNSLDSQNRKISESNPRPTQKATQKTTFQNLKNLIKSIFFQSPKDIHICTFSQLKKLNCQIPKHIADPNEIISLILANAAKQGIISPNHKAEQINIYFALHDSIYDENSRECEAYLLDSQHLDFQNLDSQNLNSQNSNFSESKCAAAPNPRAQICADAFLYAQKFCPPNTQKALYIAPYRTLLQVRDGAVISSVQSDSENLNANAQMLAKVFGTSELIKIENLNTLEILQIARTRAQTPILQHLANAIKTELQNCLHILKFNQTARFENPFLFFQTPRTRTLRTFCTLALLIFCVAYPLALKLKIQNLNSQISALQAQTYDLQALELPIQSELAKLAQLQEQNKNAKDKITFFLEGRQTPISADLNDFFKLVKQFGVLIDETAIAKGAHANAIQASITANSQTAITNLLSALNEKWSAQLENIAYENDLARSEISIICRK